MNENIILYPGRKTNTKASEEYVSVKFIYPDADEVWEGWVPVEYGRTGVSIPEGSAKELEAYLDNVYVRLHPSGYEAWKREQDRFWRTKKRAVETKEIFYTLSDGRWHCRNCEISNPNFARRVQDLKEYGYTVATMINYKCPVCGNMRSTRLQLLPLDRVELAGRGYETWSDSLRSRIMSVLGRVDAYECVKSKSCLPDHKFSEIRWDENTKSENPDDMSDDEIRDKFQLLSNQRNQHKREVCRNCFQTGRRGTIFGISFFYEGGPYWDPSIPQKGKEAERGCIGCPWYDIARWRRELQNRLDSMDGEK